MDNSDAMTKNYFDDCGTWELRYQECHTPWERGYAAPPLQEWIETKGPLKGKIVVPGCGFGHDVRLLAEAGGLESEVVGIDLAPSALEEARRRSLKFTNIDYHLGNLFELPKEFHGKFDWVFEHTCFCAIDPGLRDAYVSVIAALLKPGGQVLAIFYMNPWDPGEEPANGGPPFGSSRQELDARFTKTFELIEEYVPNRFYPDRAQRELVRYHKLHPWGRM
jgi:methyl halide transferase